jgi:hypothetical protein
MIKKFLGIKKIIAGVLSVVMFTGAVVISPDVLSTTLEVNATTTVVSNDSGGINVNGIRDGKVENIDIADYTEAFDEDAEDILREFGLDHVEHSYGDDDGWYKDSATYYPIYEIWRSEDGSFTIPDSYRTSIQIKNAAKADMIYLDTLCEKYLQVTTNGTLTANYENNIPSNSNQEYIYDYIRIYYKQKYVTIQIHIMDYDLEWQDKYVYNTIAEYVNSHTDNSMTDYEKMCVISEWLQTFPYECPGSSPYEILTGAGGGDCWAFPRLVKKIANYMGWTCKTRWAYGDLGASETHRNSILELDGKLYIFDTGTPQRKANTVLWDVSAGDPKGKTAYVCYDDFLCYEYSTGIAIYQYLGFDDNIVIPDEINGKPVKMIYADFYNSLFDSGRRTLIVPDTVVGRIQKGAYGTYTHVETKSGVVINEGIYDANGVRTAYDFFDANICGVCSSYDYTGKAITPDVKVYSRYTDSTTDAVELTRNIDYTVSYSNNVKAGTATVTVTGINDYAFMGTISKTFEIVPETIQQETSEETTYISTTVTTTTNSTTNSTTQTTTQTIVKTTENSENITETAIISGDANEDGKLDSRDAVVVLKDFAGQMVGIKSTLDLAISDMNSDGKINSTDAVIILKTYAQNLIHN